MAVETKLFAKSKVVKLSIKKLTLLSNTAMLTLAALGVHLLTSLGIVCSLLAILAVFEGNLNLTFLWLGVALFIDAIDGSLARKIGVSRFTPNINGLMMDSIVDFTNYILIPCLILSTADFFTTKRRSSPICHNTCHFIVFLLTNFSHRH